MRYQYPEHARLLSAFCGLFQGQPYAHRDASRGNFVAAHLYEDLVVLGHSPMLVERATAGRHGLSRDIPVVGQQHRRGDGVFGVLNVGARAATTKGFAVRRGPLAAMEIGAEVKIVCKAMVRQIGRVVNDLHDQARQFRGAEPRAICVAFVGVNHAPSYTSYEGPERRYETTGAGRHLHPCQEADEVERRLNTLARPHFDELVLLPFVATNADPYHFDWVDFRTVLAEYSAALTRVSRLYDQRFCD